VIRIHDLFKELIANKFSIEKIKNYLGVNSLAYLSDEGMLRATRMPNKDFCTACFSGRDPIPVEAKQRGKCD
jgi:amidophosphoribosyltransferase